MPRSQPPLPVTYRLEVDISGGSVREWTFARNGNSGRPADSVCVCLDSIFECLLPLQLLQAPERSTLRVRFSLWRDRLPLDALPQDGTIDVHLVPENELSALPYAKP